MQTSEATNTAKQHDDEQTIVDVQAAGKNTEQVDLSRRRLFSWGAGSHRNKMPERSSENVEKHDDVVVQQPVNEEGVEPSENDAVVIEAITVIDLLAKYIYETSTKGQLTCYQDLPQLLRNYEESLRVIVSCEQTDHNDKLEWMQISTVGELNDEEVQVVVNLALYVMMRQADDICYLVEVVGKKDRYYYDNRVITTNYARMLVLMADEQHWQTLAEMTRFECKTYPRPYSVMLLQESPFNLSVPEVEIALKALSDQPQCEDIKQVCASNGALYLYSQTYMVEALAQSLCEWIEVGQFDNP